MFTPRVLALVRDLTEDAWQIPNSTRVDGITNFQHTWADGDELIVEDLVGEGEITTAAVNRARTESKTELPATVEHVRMLLDKYRTAYPEVEIHASGIAMMNYAFAEAPMRDMPFVMPLMFGAFVLAIILRPSPHWALPDTRVFCSTRSRRRHPPSSSHSPSPTRSTSWLPGSSHCATTWKSARHSSKR